MVSVSVVQPVSHAWIKPSTPTGSRRQQRTDLSDWDNVMFASYIPLLLFYTNSSRDPNFMNSDILKNSLARTLEEFYPLAGRLMDIGNGRDAINNNDEGVLFVEAEYLQNLDDFREDGYLPCQMDFHRMFPIHFYCSLKDPLFAVQATRFADGGVALGIMMLHKVADMYSLSHFLDAWSKTSRSMSFTPANFDRRLVQFPKDTIITKQIIDHFRQDRRANQASTFESAYQHDYGRPKTHLKTVILEFHNSDIQSCKKEAHTPEMIANKDWVSSKDALFAMLLRAVIRSRNLSEKTDVKAITFVNGRSKMKNNKEMDYYFGNWTVSQALATNLEQTKTTLLAHTAVAFRQTAACLDSSLFHGISKLYTLHGDLSVNYLSYQPNSDTQTTIHDISVLPFCKVDFGFGCTDRIRNYVAFGGNGCMTIFGRKHDRIAFDVQLQMDVDSVVRFIDDPDIKKYVKNIFY
ncbi:transferase [Sporodiniella umbellata]|nr:transferase [Sporodiniella umbellata]